MKKLKEINSELMAISAKVVMGGIDMDKLAEIEAFFKDVYKKAEESNKEIEAIENDEKTLVIPALPKGDKYNPYPRMMYALICEFHSLDKYFTVTDMQERIGSSKNQVRLDIERLEREGFIKYVNSYTGARATKFYKYKPSRL